jgi:hypothetical protein
LPNKYKVTWKDGENEFVETFTDPTNSIEDVPQRFKTITGRQNVKVIRVENLGFVP